MANRISEVYVAPTRDSVGCRCEYPCCVEVADVVQRASPSGDLCMDVERHFDCLHCGPFRQKLTVAKVHPDAIRRGTVLKFPVFWGYRTE